MSQPTPTMKRRFAAPRSTVVRAVGTADGWGMFFGNLDRLDG